MSERLMPDPQRAIVEEEGALHEVARDLASAHDVPDVLRRIAELSRAAAAAEASYLERIDRARNEVEVVATAGEAAPVIGARVPYPGSLAQEVVEQDKPEVVTPEEMAGRPIASALSAHCGRCTALVVPLISETEALGALILFRAPEKPEFAPEEISRLRLFADMGALALRRVLLQEEATERLAKLEESERRFRLLVQGVKDYAIFMLDPQGRIASWNEGAARIKGYTAEEILGKHFSTFYTEEDRAREHPRAELRIAAREGSYEEEGWRIKKDGGLFWAHVTITAIRDETGALIGFAKVTRDLTERRRHQGEREQLLERERSAREQVSTVLERITDAFFALDSEWRFTYMNTATREVIRAILQRDPDEVLGLSFWDVVPQFRGTRFEEEYRGAMRTQESAHFVEYAPAFGVWFDVHAYPSPEGLSVYFRDVTEQKRIQESLEIERRRLRAVLDALPVGVFISDAHGKILEANPAAQAIWGGEIPLVERPEDYGAYVGWWPDSGERIQPEDWPLARAIRNKDVVAGEEIQIESFGGARKTILVYALPIRDASGEVFGGVGVVVDITERQRLLNEARAARTEAERANRSKSEFLATMSHEIRTPINAIIGYTELLELGITGPITAAQRTQLERVRSSSAHLLGLINDILDLAKVEAGRMTVAKDRAVVQHAANSALALVRPQAAERGVEIENECGEGPRIPYCGDEDRVRQILVNLLSNAVKFTEAGGKITLRCGTTKEPEEGTRLEGSGPWAYVAVEDTGIGIAPDQLEAVFRPFVQADGGHTRTRGGTGLGLTISRQLARLMEGDLTGRSEVGKGSVFTLWLPEPDRADSEASLQERGGIPRREVLLDVGRTVLQQSESIMEALAARIRQDPVFTGTAEHSDADLQDHGVAFLSDIAQSLVGWEASEVEPLPLLRDGGEIQRVISELHGAQRARLGWGEAQIQREFAILREEVERAVRQRVLTRPADELADALGVLLRCLDSAERISCRALTREDRD